MVFVASLALLRPSEKEVLECSIPAVRLLLERRMVGKEEEEGNSILSEGQRGASGTC